jgi:hypothetical protein
VLYDFGQNASFMPRLRVRGPAGAVVRLTPGEVIDANSAIDRGTMGGAHRGSAWWQYTKATDGEESWFPRFYYVGSRYLNVELLAGPSGGALPEIVSLESVVVHSTAQPLGHFATSNPLLNRIHELVRWAQRSKDAFGNQPHRALFGINQGGDDLELRSRSAAGLKAIGAVTLAAGVAFTAFELFVAALQAYIFTLLTAVYINLSEEAH